MLTLTEQLPGVDVPDLVTSDSVLPAPPLNFDSAGLVTMGVGFNFVSLNSFVAVSLDPVQVPEPLSGASAIAALLPLGLLARRRRGSLSCLPCSGRLLDSSPGLVDTQRPCRKAPSASSSYASSSSVLS